ncbi:MAG: hypothetical protein IAE94_01860 [Chthoniobacterales bacterium]|nr:hypothetical protein [Chthoniobacterales bacterium]
MARKKNLPPGAGISEETSAKGTPFFRARLSHVFLGEGSKKKAFPTYAEAEAWVFEEQENLGKEKKAKAVSEVWNLSEETLREVSAALAVLDGRPSLLAAAQAWVQHLERVKTTKTMREAITALHDEQKLEGLTDRHIRDCKAKLLHFWGGFLDKKVSEITPEDVSEMLKKPAGMHREKAPKPPKDPNVKADRPKKGQPPRVPQVAPKVEPKVGPPASLALREKRKRYSRILFNFAIDQFWLPRDANPLGLVRRKKKLATDRNKEEKYILSPLEVARLLWAAQNQRPEALGGLCLKLFSGMRNNEMESVRWGAILDGSVFLKAAHVKTGRTRASTVEPVLTAWLEFIVGDKEPGDLVFDYLPNRKGKEGREAAWQIALREIATAAGFKKWPQNSLRHCFSSYHYQLYKDAALTATEVGNSEAVIKANYLNAVRPGDCSQFWRLFPSVVEALAQTPETQENLPDLPDEPTPEPDFEG